MHLFTSHKTRFAGRKFSCVRSDKTSKPALQHNLQSSRANKHPRVQTCDISSFLMSDWTRHHSLGEVGDVINRPKCGCREASERCSCKRLPYQNISQHSSIFEGIPSLIFTSSQFDKFMDILLLSHCATTSSAGLF